MADFSRTSTQSRKLVTDAGVHSCDIIRLREILDSHKILRMHYIDLKRFPDKVEIYTSRGTICCSADLSQADLERATAGTVAGQNRTGHILPASDTH